MGTKEKENENKFAYMENKKDECKKGIIMLKKLLLAFFLVAAVVHASELTEENVAELYVATFNRAPDADGLSYWIKDSGLTLEGIAKSFFEQKEAQELYPGEYSNEVFIDEVYHNLFNRLPDTAGKAYWFSELESGNIDRSAYILAVINGALGDDKVILENKTIVGLAFSEAGLNDVDEARDIMQGVAADPTTVEEALEKYGLQSDNPGDNPDEGVPGDDESGWDNTGNDNPDDVTPPEKTSKAGWYLRTVAKAQLSNGQVFEHSTAGVFGELYDSVDGKDRHDIASYGKAVFQVRFINDELDKNRQYFSDYRKYDGYDKKQVWTFQIKNEYDTNLADASLQIDVEQMRDILKKEGENSFIEMLAKNDDKRSQLVLVDVDNQKTYSYSELKTANLSMDGKHNRTFRWVFGDVNQDDIAPLYEANTAGRVKTTTLEDKTSSNDFPTRQTIGTSKFGMPPE